ncbi:TetR/AcrR family transcriptional regulator [Aquibacillus saliphilus]|uniref:TetR/AcrR family transcriptional regulator n=1 Tax=Aquibacillus saliphilus TaxID=1909422 RepID=UPI001CEFBCDC|nr:TetR/AcrR family transcriptional regulator C-terminal domain-containing protein [Aquibacillus saliphilus]
MSRKLDPRVERTRQSFMDALLELMEQKDFQKISILEIAQTARLNRSTFYLHFFDRDDLMQQMLDEALNELRESVKLTEAEFEYASDKPHPIFIRLFEKMMEDRKFYSVILANDKIPYFTNSVLEMIMEFIAKAKHYLINDEVEFVVPLEISSSYVASAYLGVINWWLKNEMPYTPHYMAIQLTRMSTVGPYRTNPFLKESVVRASNEMPSHQFRV